MKNELFIVESLICHLFHHLEYLFLIILPRPIIHSLPFLICFFLNITEQACEFQST